MANNKVEDALTASSLITAPEYMVCGVVLSSRLTAEEYARLEDYEAERDLIGLRAKLERLQDKNSKDNRDNTSPQYTAQLQKLAGLEAGRTAMLERLTNDPLAWDDNVDDANLTRLEERIAEGYAKLEALKPDPATILKVTTQNQKDLNALNAEFRRFYLEYVHGLATARGLTKEKLTGWQERAEPQDLSNASQLIRLGKARLTSMPDSTPHVRTPAKMKN